ncbi:MULTISPECIES: hypothetical protein [Janthinobacterium]|uniref:Lipocalin-like domain-containing protein n=1 Tax=Janthinobacterium kumbetense TaxID=2950280 RepID=A0ABT0WPD2_9BURK|nr:MULTISPECIES: hypothetical protein [Janthinobacterium]MCM2564751.1 hypothetical protein [Janthinobacterium kumbetense]MDN2676195.1 hypothetical protein [Janthinobacterium sp. SUN033]
MKKLFFGITTACCALLTNASAAPVEDFIGTWKLERTTVPNYVVIKQEGERLVALRYARNVLTNKIVERRFPASYANGDITIAAGETVIQARSVNDVATVTMLAEAYKKISSSTAVPTSEEMSQI